MIVVTKDAYTASARRAYEEWGFKLTSVHETDNPAAAASRAQVDTSWCRHHQWSEHLLILRPYLSGEATPSSFWTTSIITNLSTSSESNHKS